MTKTRTLKENKGLPQRWRFRRGAYSYQIPPRRREEFGGKYEIRLGKTLQEAYRKWAEICEPKDIETFSDLIDRYMVEVVSHKKPSTQRSNKNSEKYLRAAFGEANPNLIKPVHVYKYRDTRSKQGKTTANRDLEMLSHIFTKAIEWGVIESHPMKGKVVKNSTKPRDRLITPEEFDLFYNEYATPMIKAYIVLKLIMPLRKGDILRIKRTDLKPDGIHVHNSKSERPIIFEWSDELKAAVRRVLTFRKRPVEGMYLFCTKTGQPYVKENGTTHGFDSTWQRCMKKFEQDGNERFWEHDIRALVASEAESAERAKALLNHSSIGITEKHYRRGVERITPHKSPNLKGKL